MRRRTGGTGRLWSATAVAVAAWLAAPAARAEALPLSPGEFYFAASDDCGGPTTMRWDGKSFVGDDVYIDNVVAAKKLAGGAWLLTSRPPTRDENTRAGRVIWRATATIAGPNQFTFEPHAAKQRPDEVRTYKRCPG